MAWLTKAICPNEAPKKLKILTLNILHGGGKRTSEITRYISNQHADVVVLTEFRDNKNAELLRGQLRRDGMTWFAATSLAPKQNGVCIASRTEFNARTYPELDSTNGHRVISAHFPDVSVYGLYFPQKLAKSVLFDFLLHGPPSKDPAVLLVGDFNTGLHRIDEEGTTFHCTRQFETLSRTHYVDSWRSRNTNSKEFSWYSPKGNGFRIDHMFTTPKVDEQITRICYDQTPRLAKMTDHAALMVECGI
ncbi:MAG: hypothetical protein EYC71_11440 [Gammaproteobacteria bacterium]|nr:MAG: hypothetical protein EYC71_11440 [Gammaproteobacteria bacterium]